MSAKIIRFIVLIIILFFVPDIIIGMPVFNFILIQSNEIQCLYYISKIALVSISIFWLFKEYNKE